MDGVSGRAVAFAAEGVRRLGFDPYAIAFDVPAELRLDLDRASRPRAAVPWPAFVAFSKRIGVAVGGPEGLRELGRQASTARSFRIFEIAGRALTDPSDIYWMGVRWVGPTLFPMILGRIRERLDGRIEEVLELADGYEPCPELFHVMQGAMAEMPRAWGHERSDVELELEPRGARLTIQTHAPRRGRLRRWIRRLNSGRSVRQLMDELERQQESLQASYLEVREARDRVEAQARALERVDAIGRRLSEHIEIDALADALVAVLTRDLGFLGIELRFGPPRGAEPIGRARVTRTAGATEGPPDIESPLRSAQGHEGVFRGWRPRGTGAAARHEPVFERLLPWITIALDNALSYEELQRTVEGLEERISERTARLVAANHHLVREIEERERATDALLASEAQLRASERLASVGTLAAGIAHEINNPIGSILAAAQFAQYARQDGDDTENTETAAETLDTALDDIVREARRCGGIVRSVLQFARNERTEKWDCTLDDLLRRAVRLTSSESEQSDATVHLDLPSEPVWVHVNPIQIEQAVINLVRNAIEAGGRDVRVRLDPQPVEGLACVEVLDDGPGLPDAERARILEPFYTTRRQEGGTGLGLSVVHGIAAEHAGHLRIDTSEAGGLAIRLDLPMIPPPARAPEKQATPA